MIPNQLSKRRHDYMNSALAVKCRRGGIELGIVASQEYFDERITIGVGRHIANQTFRSESVFIPGGAHDLFLVVI